MTDLSFGFIEGSFLLFDTIHGGVFWYHIGWGGRHISALFVVQLPPNLAS